MTLQITRLWIDTEDRFALDITNMGSAPVEAAEGDVLVFGIGTATADQFQINTTHTSNAAGERSGDDNLEEAFVIYRPTGQTQCQTMSWMPLSLEFHQRHLRHQPSHRTYP